MLELFYVSRPCDSVRLCSRSCGVLIVARQRTAEPASEPQSPKRRCPLCVCDVIEHLTDAPLLGSIPVQRFLLRDDGAEFQRGFQLALKDTEDVIPGYPTDVSEIVKCRFILLWAPDSHTSCPVWRRSA